VLKASISDKAIVHQSGANLEPIMLHLVLLRLAPLPVTYCLLTNCLTT